MDYLVKVLALIVIVAGGCLPLTTAIMLFSLKRKGRTSLSLSSIASDSRSFSKLQREYAEAEGNRIIPVLNRLSFRISIGGLIGLPILLVLAEIVPVLAEIW